MSLLPEVSCESLEDWHEYTQTIFCMCVQVAKILTEMNVGHCNLLELSLRCNIFVLAELLFGHCILQRRDVVL